MNSFSSASQMCEPLPRAINGGLPPTERNARTGEFTPPGIMLSARCCKRRDCSTFRVVVDGIVASSTAEEDLDRCEDEQPTTIAAPLFTNLPEIHRFAIIMQHGDDTLDSIKLPF